MKKHIPNFITLLNLFAGCLAIVAVSRGALIEASWWILLAAFLDLLDGLMARLLDAGSEVGKQLDSLADIVSFGVAPGFILYTLISAASEQYTSGSPELNLMAYAGFLIPLFGALRLAKFNTDPGQQYDFKGLPIPANALFILSIPITINCEMVVIPWLNAIYNDPYALIALTVLLSALMVSPLQLFSLKFRSIQWKHNRGRVILFVAAVILFFSIRFASVPFIILLYILLSQFKLNDPIMDE